MAQSQIARNFGQTLPWRKKYQTPRLSQLRAARGRKTRFDSVEQRQHIGSELLAVDQCRLLIAPAVMDRDFDHLRDKVFVIAFMKNLAPTKLLAEAAKCDVVCSNCHRMRTHGRDSNYSYRKGL